MKAEIELINPDYDGIAKVLAEFEKLYKVCGNTEMLDRCVEEFCSQRMIITPSFQDK